MKTANELIHIGKPIPFDVQQFLKQLGELAEASYENNEDIVQMVADIVTTFHPVGNKPTGEEVKNRHVIEIQKTSMGEVAATAVVSR